MNDGPDEGARRPIPEVPGEVLDILAELHHHSRLPILLALEQRPRTAQELAVDLGLTPDQVQFAIKLLRRSGLVTVLDSRPTTHNLLANVYATPFTGWSDVLASLSAVAASARRG
jgi:DNA-binding transcriptional ArsR family regulator